VNRQGGECVNFRKKKKGEGSQGGKLSEKKGEKYSFEIPTGTAAEYCDGRKGKKGKSFWRKKATMV